MATEFHDPWRSSRRRSAWLDKLWLAPVLVSAVVLTVFIVLDTMSQSRAPIQLRHLTAASDTVAEKRVSDRSFGFSARVAATLVTEHMPETAEQVVANVFERSMVPEVVHYTIEKHGTLKLVANLFGIYHHEIQELNPGVPLNSELSAGTSVLIYRRDPDQLSHSIGSAGNGKLEGAVPIAFEGPGRVVKAKHQKAWGTAATVGRLDYILRQWARRYADAPPLLVGNLSLRTGGRVQPHRTHQSGRDFDMGYPQILSDPKAEVHWADMNADNLDAKRTWDLLHLIVETGPVEVMFIDITIQELLYEYAMKSGLHTEDELRIWLQYPDGKSANGRVIRHADGHLNHIHARFGCRPVEKKCVQKYKPPQPIVKPQHSGALE